jgi:hypothetical protein
MPFPFIPTALGVCFLLVWAFIGGMVFRDGQLAARRDRETDINILPLGPARPTDLSGLPDWHEKRRVGKRAVRAAS